MTALPDLPFRLGTTSYILPEGMLPNARFLAGQVADMELVLYETDDGQNNLPAEAEAAALRDLALQTGLTYTVHLPLDLRLGADGGEQHRSLLKAQRAIELTRALEPWAYVAHLDGHAERHDPDPAVRARWNDQAVRALELVAGWAGGPERLALENLETYPLDFWDEVLRRVPVACCVDIGHLWLDGHDPLPFLVRRLERTRVLHIHGGDEHGHRSLSCVPAAALARVLNTLIGVDYRGVLTLEIFGEDDFRTSLAAVRAAIQFI